MQSQIILRVEDVMARTGLARSTLYWLIAQGEFPRPVKLGKKASGWLDSEIADWQRQRIAERDSVGA